MTEREYYEVKNYKKAFELLLKADRVISTDLTISSKKSSTSISSGWIAFFIFLKLFQKYDIIKSVKGNKKRVFLE